MKMKKFNSKKNYTKTLRNLDNYFRGLVRFRQWDSGIGGCWEVGMMLGAQGGFGMGLGRGFGGKWS